ncbi:GumC family protein [Sagittula sp. S175]|uniref:GumC family protein n=1 Tax=Sagittula sp. S175 TaxID=3415129 RepID=UPI003C7EA9F1
MNQFQSFGEILAAVKRRGWLILGIFLAGCILSVNFALTQQKVYEATAVVQIEDATVSNTSNGAATAANDTSRRLQLIEQRLMSRDNLVRVMEKHELFTEDASLTDSERVYMMRQSARIKEITNSTPVFSAAGQRPSGLMITVQLADAEKAAVVANDLMESVIVQSRTRSEEQARETLAFYMNEEARVDAEIVALEDMIAEYKTANAAQLPAGVMALRTQLTTLRDSELNLEQEIISIQSNDGRKRAEDVERQLGLLQDQLALVSARAAQIEAQIASAPGVERELTRLEREMDKLKDQYSVITRSKAEAEMGQALQDQQAGGRFEVLETALVPENPMSSSRKKIAGVGAFGSLLLALAVAAVVEMMNPAIRNPAQMERLLGIQPVVSIPVVATGRDRAVGGTKWLGKALALFAMLAGLVAWLGKASGLGSLLGNVLPRRVVAGE